MSKKKPIDIFEEHLDKLATTTVEKAEQKEYDEIYYLVLEHGTYTTAEALLKVLVSKGIVSLKDFKRVLEK